MNIGIFTDTYSPQISGVATSIKIMEKELRKRGHNVYIFTTTDPNADRESEKGRVFRMPSIPFLFFPERRIAVAGVNKFIKLVGQLDLDIIHTHTEFSLGLLGKKSRRNMISLLFIRIIRCISITCIILRKGRS
ncbi:GDP-mannose-dependent alpha-mannosyltransferase [Listeria grayi]|uniref:GDP-mannose-dependent alpha-mannosyltransferase n=1 Tax=Listeria grayi TaxID=1641 RepID=A0A378MDP9_LISGR|nr:GDP-mannose-dependent alpha-mannosyltransferase [Listeria grayi]